jgi:hypothetical protein
MELTLQFGVLNTRHSQSLLINSVASEKKSLNIFCLKIIAYEVPNYKTFTWFVQ